MRAKHIIVAGLALLPAAASAAETITYQYDAKGRLTQVAHSGGPTDGQTATYAFDAADNRASTQMSGAHARVIVVPLGGFTLIPAR